jgi:hypothetical protein
MEVIGKLHAQTVLLPREIAPDTQWIGGWMGSRAGLDTAVKKKFLAPVGTRTSDYLARCPALYHSAIPVPL